MADTNTPAPATEIAGVVPGSYVRAWRNRLGLSRDGAAAALKISVATLKALENGNRRVTERVKADMDRIEAETPARTASVAGAAIRVVGGGTFTYVRRNLALAYPAFGPTAREIAALCAEQGRDAQVILTRMADPASPYVTNDDLAGLADALVADAGVRIVFWNAAVCDFEGQVGKVASGRGAPRLATREGPQTMTLRPSEKIVGRIRATRKDIFLVAFKATFGATDDEMYQAGLDLVKGSHVNLCLVNDQVTGRSMVVAPEEARYHVTDDPTEALRGLVEMALLRARCTFTRSTVVEHPGVAWDSPDIPANLRAVVDHCIRRGAYKPHHGKRGPVTAGHFAVRGAEGKIITSRRWSNFNALATTGMILIEPVGTDRVIAYGGKPSVGGQSQRIVFAEHPDLASIVHFHCPLKPDHPDQIPLVEQRPNECGSHECGEATSRGLKPMGGGIHAVMLDNHGPNIVYGPDVPADRVIAFIERNFDLDAKTGGPVAAEG